MFPPNGMTSAPVGQTAKASTVGNESYSASGKNMTKVDSGGGGGGGDGGNDLDLSDITGLLSEVCARA